MAELFVTPIATGDSSRNKATISLNNAGTSPRNPAMYGLGMGLFARVVPGVNSFRVWVGLDAEPRLKLLPQLLPVNTGLYRHIGRVGVDIGLSVDYSAAVRLFFDIEANSGVGEVTESREFWVQSDPLIEVVHCGACNAWCCEVASAYQGPLGGGAFLTSDPGPPPQTPTVTTPSGVPPTAVTVSFTEIPVMYEETVVGFVSFSANGEYSLIEDSIVIEGVTATGYGELNGNPVRFTLSGTFIGSGSHDEDGEFTGTGSIELSGTAIDAITAESFAVTANPEAQFFHNESPFTGQRLCQSQSGSGVEPSLIAVGPNQIVSLVMRDEGTTSDPQIITFQLMRDWQDEFGQFQFGGALYVSVFDADGEEGELDEWIEPVVQMPIREFRSVTINQLDPDHEYKLIFRFRSELDDELYVDKLVRLRLLTSEVMQYRFGDSVHLDDMPNIVQTGSAFQFDPSVDIGLIDAISVVDSRLVQLPLPGSSDPDFPGQWMNHWGLVYGREVVVIFRRQYDGVSYEAIYVTYRYEDGIFTKVMMRRDVSSKSRSFTPDTRIRLVMPTLPEDTGPVFLEFLQNLIRFTSATLMTELGSLNIPLPLRSGRRYDVSDLFESDPLTGSVKNTRAMLLLMTRESCRVYEVYPTSFRPHIRQRLPAIEESSDDPGIVIPTVVSRTAEEIVLLWPSETSNGNTYSFETVSWGSPVLVSGPRGMVRETASPGGTTNISTEGLLSLSDPLVSLVFAVSIPSYGEFDHLVEIPTWPGFDYTDSDGFPDSGVLGNGALGLVYFDNQIVITQRPPRLQSVDITGPGGTRTLVSQELKLNEWLNIGETSQDAASLSVEYHLDDGAGGVITSPIMTLPKYTAMPQRLVSEFSLGANQWRGAGAYDTVARMPKARVNRQLKTIEFDFAGRYDDWSRWSLANPLDGQMFTFTDRPLNLTPVDIARAFRTDSSRELQPGHCVVVTFLHQDGPQVSCLYQIVDGKFVEPIQLNVLRGRAWKSG